MSQSATRGERLQAYLKESDISLEQHIRRKQLALAEAFKNRRKIYLDTNFWVWLRQAEAGHGNDNQAELLKLLQDGVESGQIVCPVSDSSISELFLQSDARTREATAKLMDRLSLGLALIDQEMRMGNEVSRIFFDHSGQNLRALDELCWCRTAMAWGVPPFPVIEVESSSPLAIQKGVFDDFWETSLADFSANAGALSAQLSTSMTSIAERLNSQIKKNAAVLTSFQKAFQHEAAGIVSLFSDIIRSSFESQYIIQFQKIPDGNLVGFSELQKAEHLLSILLMREDAPEKLPSLHVMTLLHAAHRWDKPRVLDAHDIHDFNHATAALAYCDAFFTEKPLRTMLEQRHVDAPRKHKTIMASSIAEAIEVTRSLLDAGGTA